MHTLLPLLLLMLLSVVCAARPNIVLIMTDDQGWGDVGYNGHPELKTPHLDELARTGLRLDRFYAAHYNCSPTRGSVMTGRHPTRYGTLDAAMPFKVEELTVAEVLRDAGYATGHFGKWHLAGTQVGQPLTADLETSPGNCGFDEWVSASNYFDLDPILFRQGRPEQFKGEGSDVTTSEAIKFIQRQARDRRDFLAVVWFGSPPTPLESLPADRAQYRHKPLKIQHYYAELTAVDRSVGRLREALRQAGVADDTILWFCSDNGPWQMGPISSGGLRGEKGTFFEGGIRVPGLVEWPARIRKPRTSMFPSSTLDIFPTVLAAAGVTPKHPIEPLDGINLLPLFDGRMERRSKPMPYWDALAKHGSKGRKIEEVGLQPGHTVWFDWPFKLHRNAVIDRAHRGSDKLPPVLLYNIETDPKETNDLSAQEPERTQRMIAELERWMESVQRSIAGHDYRK